MAVSVTKETNENNLKPMKSLGTWKYLFVSNSAKFYNVLKTWIYNNWKCLLVILIALALLQYTNRCLNSGSDISDKVREQKDVSSSIASMEPLLKVEQVLIQALHDHANQLQFKVDAIRRGISTMRKPNEVYNIDEEEFLSNPFNSFPMLRRLKHEWKAWEKYLKAPVQTEFIEIIQKTRESLNDFDLTESAEAVQRLREIYDIQPNDWTNGKLHLAEYEIPFTALDCYAVAFLLHKQEKYEAADEWYEAALKSYRHQNIYKYLAFNRSTIFEKYAENLLKQNRTALALMITNTGLKNDPGNFKLAAKKAFIESLNVTVMHSRTSKSEDKLQDSIKRGCRGEYIYNATSQLYCYYNWTTNDFVRLAPFKVEKLHADPLLLLYHDVITDDEINGLKSIAKNNLKRSGLVGKVVGNERTTKYNSRRTSKNAWIKDHHNFLTQSLNERLEDMTGFYTWGTSLFVGNYGLGGHFKEHKDCILVCNKYDDQSNCDARLATVLIYMTNVESGGATIFPELEISVAPLKGTALVWYDLRNDMIECDDRTLHMACPVVVGSKWFLIKWIHFKDQIFRKPCYE